jgi:hypothetical protein
MAKRTGMSAIERLSNSLTYRRAFRVIDEHRCPRQRLQNDPLQADRAAKGENRDDPA